MDSNIVFAPGAIKQPLYLCVSCQAYVNIDENSGGKCPFCQSSEKPVIVYLEDDPDKELLSTADDWHAGD